MVNLDGKTAIVTGAAQGIGRAIAERLVNEGAQVAIFDILESVHATARDISRPGREVFAAVADVGNPADCERFVAQTVERFGGVDILVNNAGVWRSTPVTDPWEKAVSDFDEIMDVNVKGAMVMSRLCVPLMIKRGGGDILYISTDYVLPARREGVNPGDTDLYNASKWALNGFIDAAPQVLDEHNIRVNGFCMGPTDTPMLRALFEPGGKLEYLRTPDGPPKEFVEAMMDAAEIARLFMDLMADGRTGENIGIWSGYPIELGPRRRWDVRLRERADFTGQPLRDFGPPPWTDAPEPVWHRAVRRPADE